MKKLIGFDNELNRLLANYKSKNLHSSLIIYGPKGIGKRNFIDNYIISILKHEFKDNNFLHHLNLFKNNTHPNIKLLKKNVDQKTKKIKSHITIDQIRNLKKFINDTSSIKNLCKIIVIDSADDLNMSSANSFLKNLEEPNMNTYIFLISHSISSLLPTIRSRCLKIKLSKHTYENFEKILINEIEKIDVEEIKILYDLTYGSPGDAIFFYKQDILEIFDNTLEILNSNKIDKDKIIFSNLFKNYDNDKFRTYISFLKSILVLLSKLKNNIDYSNSLLSTKISLLKKTSSILTTKIIIDRFDFLIKNENDLFTYNLDKRLFMLNFLTN